MSILVVQFAWRIKNMKKIITHIEAILRGLFQATPAYVVIPVRRRPILRRRP